MAEDAEKHEAADVVEEFSESTAADDGDIAVQADQADGTAEDLAGARNRLARIRQRVIPRLSRTGQALVAGALVVTVLAGLTGWLGFRAYQKHEVQARRDLFVQVARQGAVNLTTINYTEVDADVQRIIDLATGAFREDFEQRSKPFIEVVKAAQSKSEGTVTDAGLESQRGDAAQVLVAVAVKSRTAAGEEAPREWRMRIEVRSVGDDAKVSNVVFVP